MDPLVRPFQVTDLKKVVCVHCQAFPLSRSTNLGKPYVRKMFQWFLAMQPGLCFVAEDDGQVVGYVVGAIGGYGRKIFRYALPQIVFGLLSHPSLWLKRDTFKLWQSYLYALNPSSIRSGRPVAVSQIQTPIRCALAGIGVLPSTRGKGVGRLLVQCFEQAAQAHNAQLLSLSVAVDNLAARRLYEACGWQADKIELEANSVHYSKKLL